MTEADQKKTETVKELTGRTSVYLNPLFLLGVDITGPNKPEASEEDILEYAVQPSEPSALADLVERYKDISSVQSIKSFSVPHEEAVLEKLIFPLKNAKSSYMLGNFLVTIALCGFIAEMLAVLLFKISGMKFKSKTGEVEPFEEKRQEEIFGRKFEKLEQRRRVDVLKGYGIITDEIYGLFNSIRSKRNDYLHNFSQDHTTLRSDAKQIFRDCFNLTLMVVGMAPSEGGTLRISPQMLEYLRQQGTFAPNEEVT